MKFLKSLFSKHSTLLIVILTFIIVSRLLRLGFPDTYYFDEVYHAFTAQVYAEGDPKGYEWWNNAPEGFAYEWLHPPIGKLIQAGSIKIFGDTPFFWRFPGVLAGLGIGILLYLFGKNVMRSRFIGLVALSLWGLSGLSLTMSRITMNDIFLTAWVILAFYFYLSKRPIWQTGIILGLAIATKWSGIFALGGLTLLWSAEELRGNLKPKKVVLGILSFFVIPIFVYFASYTQFFLQGHTVNQFVELHQQTWWYQTNLEATHPYSSQALEWPLGRRPIFAFTEDIGEKVSNIYLMGNPIILWGGLAAFLAGLAYFVKRRDRLTLFLLAGYLIMFLPWVASPRIMFFYHYLPAIPFLILLLAWLLERLWKEGSVRGRIFVSSYLVLVILSFIIHYPVWTGIPVPDWWTPLLINGL